MVRLYLFICADANEPIRLWLVVYHLEANSLNRVVKGLSRESLLDDPQLGGKRMELVSSAAQQLVSARMIAYDVQNGRFQVTDLGRIAARYYIRYKSIEIFNKLFRPQMSEADILNMMSKSTEVEETQVWCFF